MADDLLGWAVVVLMGIWTLMALAAARKANSKEIRIALGACAAALLAGSFGVGAGLLAGSIGVGFGASITSLPVALATIVPFVRR